MNSVDKFNALDGKDISRPDLYELLQLAKSEEQTPLVQRIKKVLDAYPTAESFTINLSHKESEVVPRSYLAGVDLYTPEEDESDPELALGKPVSTKEIYKMVTDHIIEMMKDATGDNVTQEWKSDKLYCMPINFDSKKPYGGINVFFIHAQQKKMTGDMVFTNPYFLTFKQVEAHKGKVKKGAVAFKVIYYTELHVYKDNDNPKNNFESYSKEKVVAHLKELGYTDDNLPLISYIPMPKYYNVFNGADIEGIDFGLDEVIIGKMTPEDAEENPAAKLIVKHYPNPPKIEHTDPNEAYYDPQEDVVNVPPFERFIGANAYYRTLFHELTHSTGVKKRLDRVLNTKFGSKEYAFEELIAEFGSVYLSAQAGIMWKTSRSHAEYLKNWAIVLEETEKDNKFMMRASAAAQKAADYILALNSEGEPAFWKDLANTPTPQASTYTHFTLKPNAWGGYGIAFTEKPSDEVRALLKAHKYRWYPAEKLWNAPKGTSETDQQALYKELEQLMSGSTPTKPTTTEENEEHTKYFQERKEYYEKNLKEAKERVKKNNYRDTTVDYAQNVAFGHQITTYIEKHADEYNATPAELSFLHLYLGYLKIDQVKNLLKGTNLMSTDITGVSPVFSRLFSHNRPKTFTKVKGRKYTYEFNQNGKKFLEEYIKQYEDFYKNPPTFGKPKPEPTQTAPQPTNFLAKIAKKYPTIPQKEINALFALTKYLKEKAPKKIEKIHPTIHNATLAKLDPEGVFNVTDHKNYWNDTIVFNVSAKGIKHTIELTDLGFKMYIDMINHLNGHPFEEEIHKGIADQLADETIQEIIKSKEDDDFLIGTRKKQRTEATEEKQLPKNTEDWDNYILDRAKKLKIDLSQYPVEKQNNIKYVISTTYYKKWEAFYEKWAKKVKCQPEHIRALMFGSGLAGQPWLVEKDETFYLDDIYIIPAFHLEDLGLAIKKGRSYIFSEIGLEIVHDLQKTRGVTKNYEEYVTDKSAEMKAKGYKWSTVKGDWVKTSNILTKDKLNRMLGNKKKQTALATPHLAVSTDRFKEMSRRELRVYTLEYYNKYLKGHKALIKKALKEVVLTSAAGRKIARGEAMYAAKVAAVEHLKELIENSTYNNWGDRKTTDGKDVIGYMNFKSKLTIDGEKRHVRISLAVYKDRKTELKNMEVGRKEKKTSQPTQNPVGTLQDEEVETSSGRKGTTKKLSTKEKTKKVSKTAPIRPSDNIRLAAPEIPNEEESHDIYVEDLPIDKLTPYLDLSYSSSKDGRTTLADRLNAAPSHREMYHIDRYDMAHFLGNLERKTTDSLVITMTGGQGSGKTRFAFQFIDDLAQRYRVGHVSIEETPDSLLYEQKALQYLNDRAVHNVEAADVRSIAELDALIKRNDVIVIDSYQKLKEIDPKFEIDKDLRKKYNGKLFLVIFQQTVDGKMRGGSKSQYDGDIILFTQKFPDYRDNYVYPDKNRYNSVPASLLRYNIAEKALIPVEAEEEPTQTNVYNLY